MKRLISSFFHASEGIKTTFSTQANFRIHTTIAAMVVISGFVFRLNLTEWAVIIVCIGMVLSTECINTAIEAAVDIFCPEYSPKAKTAKDCAAAGVLAAAAMSAVAGILIFGSRILKLWF